MGHTASRLILINNKNINHFMFMIQRQKEARQNDDHKQIVCSMRLAHDLLFETIKASGCSLMLSFCLCYSRDDSVVASINRSFSHCTMRPSSLKGINIFGTQFKIERKWLSINSPFIFYGSWYGKWNIMHIYVIFGSCFWISYAMLINAKLAHTQTHSNE